MPKDEFIKLFVEWILDEADVVPSTCMYQHLLAIAEGDAQDTAETIAVGEDNNYVQLYNVFYLDDDEKDELKCANAMLARCKLCLKMLSANKEVYVTRS